MKWVFAIVLGIALLAIPLNLFAEDVFDSKCSVDVNGQLGLEIRSGYPRQACAKCRPGVKELIDELGADVNNSFGCWGGDTPLIEAVKIKEYMTLNKSYFESKRRPGRITYAYDGTVTIKSGDEIRARKIAVIKALLERGADPDLTTCYYGKGALIEAVEAGDTEVAEMLLNAGANPTGRIYSTTFEVLDANDTVCFYDQPLDIFDSSYEEEFDHVVKGDVSGDLICFHGYKRVNPFTENRSCYAQTCYEKRYVDPITSPIEKAREKGDQKMVELLRKFLPSENLPNA
jgi:hypothetical protein